MIDLNYPAIVVAAVARFAFAAVYYTVLAPRARRWAPPGRTGHGHRRG